MTRSRILEALLRLAAEPPFRIVARKLLGRLSVPAAMRALWDLSSRPVYLLGLAAAVEQARKQGVPEICAIEFGVAGGSGLLALQTEAAALEAELGVRIRVYGFDAGPSGLPRLIGDHRDHPDAWRAGDFPMDEAALRARLTDRTELVLGDVRDTVPGFFSRTAAPPIGFVSIDVDLYSSAAAALRIFDLADTRMLWHVPVYFDDIDFIFNSRFGGELLAIEEFNRDSRNVKLDRWYGVRSGRPFPERDYLEKLFVAHDLAAVCAVGLERARVELPLRAPGLCTHG